MSMCRNGKSKWVRKQLFGEQNGLCKDCRNQFESITLTTIDHIIPLGMDGSDNYNNLQLLCLPCNMRKTKQDMRDIWAKRKEVVTT